MNKTNLVKYLTFLAKQSKLPDDGLADHVDFCIELGSQSLWNARPWSFRSEPFPLNITSEDESYELPESFAGVRSVREQESLEGEGLRYKPKEEFDSFVPKPLTYPSIYPQIYTVFQDNSVAGAQKFFIKFFPVPVSGYTMLIDMLTDSPGDVEIFPTKATAALIAHCGQFIPKFGTADRRAAMVDAANETIKLEREDSPFMGRLFKFFDDTDFEFRLARPWI